MCPSYKTHRYPPGTPSGGFHVMKMNAWPARKVYFFGAIDRHLEDEDADVSHEYKNEKFL